MFSAKSSNKSIFVITIIVSVVVIISLIILSLLINHESEKSNDYFVQKSFLRKYEAIEFEFKQIEDYQNVLKNVVQNSSSEKLKDHFKVLNEVNSNRKLVRNDWFAFYDKKIDKTTDSKILQKILNQSDSVKYKIYHPIKNVEINNFFINYRDTMYWVNYDSITLPNNQHMYYGSTINLLDLFEFFTNIDATSSSYVYVFNKDGICITHPNENYIGKNVFDFTDITATDTITSTINTHFEQDKYTLNFAKSEFIPNTSIKRFIKPIKVKNLDGYVAVNYLSYIIDEKVEQTKNYVGLLFLATILLIVFIFILFNRLKTKNYKEKATIIADKNRLLIENEQIQNTNTLIQLQQLKEQINPHFLFNSLNSLYMLIGINKENAQKFTINLSKIYRYLIVPPKENIVHVKQELDFIEQYIDLQKSRFSEELIFDLIIEDKNSLKKNIPYLCLQVTVENAIKHNIATIDQPLVIKIIIRQDFIIVKNTYQIKSKLSESDNFGLKYLQKIYNFYKVDNFGTKLKNEEFICILPFIKQK